MKKIFTFSFILFCTISLAKVKEIQLAKVKLMNDKLEILIPTHFTALLDFEIKQNFPEDNKPKIVFGDSLRECKLALYSVKNEKADAGIGALKASILSNFLAADLKLKELDNGITAVNGREYGYLEILHKSPKKSYRFFYFTNYKGYLLEADLTCPKKGYKNWTEIAREIMNSMLLKDI